MRNIHLFITLPVLALAMVLAVFYHPLLTAPFTRHDSVPRIKTGAEAGQDAPRSKLFDAETAMLDNGLQIVLIPNHRAPVITQMVWYKAGAVDESHGKTGLAHFLEHLMFKGSDNVPSGAFSRQVRALGGHDNAFTTQDVTAYHQSIAAANIETIMAMEADRMQSILLPEDAFEPERQVVLEERRQRTENDPRAHFFEQLRYALFPAHPYGTPVIGWEQDIRALDIDDARSWHERWYTPDNAILVVSGDITMDVLKPLAEQYYGPIPARPVTPTIIPPVATFPGDMTATLRHPAIHQPQIIRLYRVPGAVQDKGESLALQVLQEVMSGSAATRLYRSLVFEQKIATSANLYYNGQSRDSGTLSLSIIPAAGTPLARLEDAFDAEIANLVENSIDAQELEEAKTRMKDSAAFARDSLTGPAQIIGGALAIGQTLDDVEYWADDIDAVTAEEIVSVARKYLYDDDTGKPQFVTGHILGPEEPAAGNTVTDDDDDHGDGDEDAANASDAGDNHDNDNNDDNDSKDTP